MAHRCLICGTHEGACGVSSSELDVLDTPLPKRKRDTVIKRYDLGNGQFRNLDDDHARRLGLDPAEGVERRKQFQSQSEVHIAGKPPTSDTGIMSSGVVNPRSRRARDSAVVPAPDTVPAEIAPESSEVIVPTGDEVPPADETPAGDTTEIEVEETEETATEGDTTEGNDVNENDETTSDKTPAATETEAQNKVRTSSVPESETDGKNKARRTRNRS